MDDLIRRHQRIPVQRTTLYQAAPPARAAASYGAAPVEPTINTPAPTKSTGTAGALVLHQS